MIIDFRNTVGANAFHAIAGRLYALDDLTIIDFYTGADLGGEAIVYADDRSDLYKVYVRDEGGGYVFDEAGDAVATRTVHRRIKIVPRPGAVGIPIEGPWPPSEPAGGPLG